MKKNQRIVLLPKPKPIKDTKLYLCPCGNRTHDPSAICGPCNVIARTGYTLADVRKEMNEVQ